MKIRKDNNIRMNQHRITDEKPQTAKPSAFSEALKAKNSEWKRQDLTKLLTSIEEAGERLARSRQFQDVVKYKTLVRQFMKEAVDAGLSMKNAHTWNQFGEGRKLTIIEMLDEELVHLAAEVTNKEKTTIDLLKRIGEIEGLIINLYT
ncbi:YaaR family protein [Bacillus thermotolerans]|uniref:DUF327 family protein n=1 Tax=Bacillus thermotolerans TaxID=1221996 RepID=A0A0F5HR47_BACTR|nr:YaaR family protein [Bacillus thermotolerans]KKB35312.1 hypothetical protein QY97_01916 [Bacillus thermotolerans]KKB39380.1 hypothetical protein QY95_02403 [Bacillus thermotolerans]KKB42825.1 hypothetical protein QY96_01303 [Bacillus thermotolerans]